MKICSLFIVCVFAIVMISVIHGRRMLIKHPNYEASATLDSAAGFLILAAGAVSLWSMKAFAFNDSVYDLSFELTKLLTGAVGAMYLKQGYDKHDRDYMKKKNMGAAEVDSPREEMLGKTTGTVSTKISVQYESEQKVSQ